MQDTRYFSVEYRALDRGERILFECDSRVMTQLRLERVRSDENCKLVSFDVSVPCPGWGEECGTPTDSDLCPDCTMGRMNAQSPRIPV